MKKFLKGLFTVGAIAGVGYLGFKGYQRVSEVVKMSKTLPDYLQDLLNEKPKISINMRLNSLAIAVGMSAEAYETLNFDLSDQIQSYISDYYPCIAKLKIVVTKYIKAVDDAEADCGLNLEVEG